MGEIVPYKVGMQRGQGYNTYLQALCVKDAVTIERHDDKDPAFKREYYSEFIEEYEKIAKSMRISAGAAVSGWGQEGNVNVDVLNRSEFETSTLTQWYADLARRMADLSAPGCTDFEVASGSKSRTPGCTFIAKMFQHDIPVQ